MTAFVIWRPEPLNARLLAAAPEARRDFANASQVRAPHGINVSVFGDRVGTLDPKGAFFEFGTKPHEIKPKRRALRLADGSFVSGPIKHPGMKAEPFLKPLLPTWGAFYRRQASQAFRGF